MQPETLTLAEFKARLADEDMRKALGITITDQEALRVLVDDQQVAELYVQWRSGAFQRAQPAVEQAPPPTTPSRPLYKRPVAWIVVGAVILVVVAIIGFSALFEQMRKQQFADLVNSDPRGTFEVDLGGETLDAVYIVNCGKVRDGWTTAAQVAAAHNNWEVVGGDAEITEQEYVANLLVFFEAAEKVCG